MENFTNKFETRNIITGRDLNEYISILGISPVFISGKKVLNFGCGGTNLKKDVNENGGDGSKFVDVDIEHEPFQIDGGFNKKEVTRKEKLRLLRQEESQDDQKILPGIKQDEDERLGIDGRNFIKLEGKAIPFPDDEFDLTVALWSTYQIEDWKQKEVFDELVRVSKIIHIGPVDATDLEDIKEACEKYGSKIILLENFTLDSFERLNTLDDYKILAEANFTRYIPKRKIEIESDGGARSASSYKTAKAIIIRKNLL